MRIYFDHNATTPPHPEVIQAIAQSMKGTWNEAVVPLKDHLGGHLKDLAGIRQPAWGNPSSLHEEGRAARDAVEGARRRVAALIGASPEEIFFTSGGTEGNNTAVLGACRQQVVLGERHGQVISSPLEHPSVIKAAVEASVDGAEGPAAVTWLPVDGQGRIDPEDLRRALRARQTLLVSLSRCNHELGNLYPIAELCRLSHEHGALFHCDAVQAAGRLPLDVNALGVDLLTMSGHKLHGPKGVGAVYCREGGRKSALLWPLILGGQQEKGRRAGTENVPAIVGLGVACAMAAEGLPERVRFIAGLRDRLETQLLRIPGARLHGDGEEGRRAPGTCNVGFAGVEGELLMMNLDLCGVAVSTGAACSSGSTEPSPVLVALGLSEKEALEGVRFSLGVGNTAAEVDQVAAWVGESVARVRGAARRPVPGHQPLI